MIDIGVNFASEQLKNNIEHYINRAQSNEVSHIILTTTDAKNFEFNLNLCQKYPSYLSTTWGLHPHYSKELDTFIESTENKTNSQSIVAIGEFGLDYFRNISTPEQQIKAMNFFLEFSKERPELSLFLHERQAHNEFLSIYKNHSVTNKAVIHCFTGDKEQLKNYLDLGFFIGITGWICDNRRNQELKEALKYIPIEKLMFETDAPYLKPRTLKSKDYTNEPANLPHIIKEVATLLNIEFDTLVKTTYNNTVEFFKINKPCQTQKSKPI